MRKVSHVRFVFRAIAISALLNLCLVLSEFAGLQREKYGLFLHTTDAIAAPPGVIARVLFAPKQHTVHAFALAAAESLVCSFVFYALLIWMLFELLDVWRSHKTQRRVAQNPQG
jgi:hypothetical protein